MTDRAPAPGHDDPWTVADGAALRGAMLDRRRTLALPEAEPVAIARAIVALANTRGGEVVTGVAADEQGCVTEISGVDAAAFAAVTEEAMTLVDPGVTHLVQRRLLALEEGAAGVLHVRLSPSAPHLLTADGGIYRLRDGRAEPIRSRRALDDLYARGRGERERADRLVEAMIEKLALAHYAFYGLAIVACTHEPTAEPYRAAATDPRRLAPPDDPFVAAFGLHEQEMAVSPGEIELRTPGDVNAYMRVTRSGCVAAGEVQRRPYHDELATVAALHGRLVLLCATVARVLSVAPDTLMLPHLFIEGVRGLRLVHDPERRVVSANAPQDTTRFPLSVGDARDAAYVSRLADEAMERLAPVFPRPAE